MSRAGQYAGAMSSFELAALDGRVLPLADALVPVTDEGLLRGDGVFEVTRLYGGVPFAWAEHLERMTASARNLRLPFDAAQIDADAQALIAAAQPGGSSCSSRSRTRPRPSRWPASPTRRRGSSTGSSR